MKEPSTTPKGKDVLNAILELSNATALTLEHRVSILKATYNYFLLVKYKAEHLEGGAK